MLYIISGYIFQFLCRFILHSFSFHPFCIWIIFLSVAANVLPKFMYFFNKWWPFDFYNFSNFPAEFLELDRTYNAFHIVLFSVPLLAVSVSDTHWLRRIHLLLYFYIFAWRSWFSSMDNSPLISSIYHFNFDIHFFYLLFEFFLYPVTAKTLLTSIIILMVCLLTIFTIKRYIYYSMFIRHVYFWKLVTFMQLCTGYFADYSNNVVFRMNDFAVVFKEFCSNSFIHLHRCHSLNQCQR